MPQKTNVEKLAEAQVLDPKALNDRDVAMINDLDEAEVNSLIKVRQKLGDYSSKTRSGPCAWML
jgi:hypothetical protein